MRDSYIRLGIWIIKKATRKKIEKVKDETLKSVLIDASDLALKILEIFVDSDKDNKTQLKEMKPYVIDKIEDIGVKVLKLD